MAEPEEIAAPRKAYLAARREYGEKLAKLRSQVNTASGSHAEMVRVFATDFEAATVDLMRSGLEIYLDAAAKDRASAELDRRDQEKARRQMSRWTAVIGAMAVVTALATIIGVSRPAKPIVVSAPVVNVTAPPQIVIPAPVVNVIVPSAAKKR